MSKISYDHGTSDIQLKGETIGQNLKKIVDKERQPVTADCKTFRRIRKLIDD